MVRNYKRKTEDRWTKEDLLEALMSIKEKSIKINEASRQFGISRATLYRQYQKFIQAGGKCDVSQFRTCGGNPILTKVEEDVLEKTILDLRSQGFSVTSSDIKRICYEYCDSNSIPNQFNTEKRMASDDWYYGFLKRHINVRSVSKDSSHKNSVTTGKKRKRKGEKRQGKTKKVGKRIKVETADDVNEIMNMNDDEIDDDDDDDDDAEPVEDEDGTIQGVVEGVVGEDGIVDGIEVEDSDEGPPSFNGEAEETKHEIDGDEDDEIQMPSLEAEVEQV